MNWAEFGIDPGKIFLIYLCLFLFGIVFDYIVAWLERRGYSRGLVSLLVVAGVAVTVGMTAVISLTFALVTAGAFIASGVPMIIGSLARYVRERERHMQILRDQVRDAD